MSILKYTFAYTLISLAAILNSCSDSDAPAEDIRGPIHVLRFTDNEDFRYLCYEKINVSNEEQTLTLRLRSIKTEGDENEIARIMEKMERYRFYIHEWEGDKMQQIWPYDSTQYNLPDDFYHVWWEKENGEHVVKVALTRNDTDDVRRVSIAIWPGLKYQESPLIGYVTIIQEPASDFMMRIKYKGEYHASEAKHEPEGNIVFKDEEFIGLQRP